MAEAARVISLYDSSPLNLHLVHPEMSEATMFADSLEHDDLTKRRLAKFMGNIVLANEGSVEYVAAESASLLTVAQDYSSENPKVRDNASNRLQTDLGTNAFEILCASGHVAQVEADYVQDGFYQYGYSLRAMYAHGALHAAQPEEQERRAAECLNEFRIEDGFRSGLFKTHYFVEISRSPDDMDPEIAEGNGYDTKTWKCKLRLTDVNDKGKRLTTEAPVAGVDSLTGERHDEQGVRSIRLGLNMEADDLAATDALHRAFWVPKGCLPHGVASLAELYDKGLDYPSFFGVRDAQGNYATITQQSQDREHRAKQLQDQWVARLAADLAEISSCDAALVAMAKCAKDYAAELCGTDKNYNPAQFGDVAAAHIEAARYYASIGDQQAYCEALQEAKETAIVYMCGMRLAMEKNAAGEMVEKNPNKPEKDCDYISKKCPLCKAKNARTHETKYSISCKECKGSVIKTVKPAPKAA